MPPALVKAHCQYSRTFDKGNTLTMPAMRLVPSASSRPSVNCAELISAFKI